MTRVNINGANHQVEVQHDGGDLAYVIEKAQKLFDETKPQDRAAGPAFGFSMERKPQPSWDVAKLGTERMPVRVETEG